MLTRFSAILIMLIINTILSITEAVSISTSTGLAIRSYCYSRTPSAAHFPQSSSRASSTFARDDFKLKPTMSHRLQANLISRFFLNLNEANLNGLDAPSSPSQLSDLYFTRVVGSLGGSLAYGLEDTVASGDTASTENDIYTVEELGEEQDTPAKESPA